MRLFSKFVMILALTVWGIGCDSPPANPNGAESGNSGTPAPAIPAPGETDGTQPDEQQPPGNGLNSSPENQLTPGTTDPVPSLPQSDPPGGNP